MKEWPKDKAQLLNFEELIGPVRASMLHAYKLTASKKKSIPYDGFNFGPNSLAIMGTPEDELQEDGIAYHKERGRDLLDIILMITFNLGVEQGRRVEYSATTIHLETAMQLYKDMYKLSKKPKKRARKTKR